MQTITVSIPDNWPKHKDWRASTLQKCDKPGCGFATPDVATFLNHLYQVHLMDELTQPDTLTVTL